MKNFSLVLTLALCSLSSLTFATPEIGENPKADLRQIKREYKEAVSAVSLVMLQAGVNERLQKSGHAKNWDCLELDAKSGKMSDGEIRYQFKLKKEYQTDNFNYSVINRSAKSSKDVSEFMTDETTPRPLLGQTKDSSCVESIRILLSDDDSSSDLSQLVIQRKCNNKVVSYRRCN